MPGWRKRPDDSLFHLLSSSPGTEVQPGSGQTAAEGSGRVSESIPLVARPVPFPPSTALPLEAHGRCRCVCVNCSRPQLEAMCGPCCWGPSYLAAMQNESASHTPVPRATFQVTDTNAILDQNIKTRLNQQALCFCPMGAVCHVTHERDSTVCLAAS